MVSEFSKLPLQIFNVYCMYLVISKIDIQLLNELTGFVVIKMTMIK